MAGSPKKKSIKKAFRAIDDEVRDKKILFTRTEARQDNLYD